METVLKSIVGFDSAWTDKKTSPGAVCVFRSNGNGQWVFYEPKLASFNQALEIIKGEVEWSEHCLVAIDQPTVVPNSSGSRPVDKVAGSLISWMGGGVQPANRSKIGMFDDTAPIWRFKERLGAIEDPEQARLSSGGVFLIEVFPALALSALEDSFCERLAAPKYNPSRRKKFQLKDWRKVVGVVESVAKAQSILGIDVWCRSQSYLPQPNKSDQDRLDAIICAMIGLHWLSADRDQSIMIGNLQQGYMVTPSSEKVRLRLTAAAFSKGVQVNGKQVPQVRET